MRSTLPTQEIYAIIEDEIFPLWRIELQHETLEAALVAGDLQQDAQQTLLQHDSSLAQGNVSFPRVRDYQRARKASVSPLILFIDKRTSETIGAA